MILVKLTYILLEPKIYLNLKLDIIQIKFLVPISKAIAYYFTDENSEEGNMYYKLQYISKTNGYIVGDRITVPSQCLLECPITPTLIATDK